MDFETLSRRELQALCKKNKIPANITNVAMIEALKALSFVEGLDELMQQSPGQRTAAKQEPESVQPLTRTRRTTRKTVAKDAEGTMETPSVVQRTTRRATVTSACRKMDAQLKECEEEDKKKGTLETPAPSGVTTRRRRGVKEETVVKREYSTRRSVRLAEKVEVLDDVKNEKSDLFKTQLFANDGENVNVNVGEGLDTLEEASEVTGTEVNATMEENFEEVDESEVISVQNPHMQVGEDLAPIVENLERNDESESNPVQEQNIQTVEETVNATAFEEEKIQMPEVDDLILDVEQVGEESNPIQEQNIQTVEETVNATAFEEEKIQMPEVDDLKLDVEQVPLKAMDVDVNSIEENLEGHDESENVSVKDMCEEQDMAFDVNEEQVADQIYQVNDDSTIDHHSEVSLMDEADESAMPESFEGSDSVLNFKPTCLTPFKEVYVRKATSTKNIMTIITDNKENISSESNVVLAKETVKKAANETADKAKELSYLSVRQLTKMLREKLEITSKKVPQNENVNEARGRPALQTLTENQMADVVRT